MTPSQLKYEVEKAGHARYYFTRKTMKIFGDTMKNYGVRTANVIENITEKKVECWELFRKRPVKMGLKSSAYFDKETFSQVFQKSSY